MKYQFPAAVRNLEPYQPITGEYALRMDANESYLLPAPYHQEMFHQAVETIQYNRYPDPYAGELCKAFSAYYGVDSQYVTAFNGSDELLSVICGTFFGATHTLAVLEHDFSMYRLYAQMYGASCKVIPQHDDLGIDVEEMLSFIRSEGVSAVLFSNPSNPTSLGITASEAKRLVEETDALVLLDEAYMDFWNQSLLPMAGKAANLIVLKTCSKAIGFAAARVGFAITTPAYTKVLRAVKSPYNVNAISQAFASVMLADHDYLNAAAEEITNNCRALLKSLQKLKEDYPVIVRIIDSKTNFILMETTDSKLIFKELLKRSVAVRHMGCFLRVSTLDTTGNQQFLQLFEEVLEQLREE